MRARNIKPGIYKNEVLGTGDPLLFALFTGLWALADREGRLEDRPLRIKAEIFPYRTLDVDPLLDTLAEAGMIVRYKYGTAPVITRVIQIVKFTKHQNPHKNEKESELPEYKADTENSSNYSTTPVKACTTRAESFLLNPDPLNPDPPSSESRNGEAPQEDDAVLKYYSDLTNNPISDSDRASRKKLNGVPDVICKIGVRLSVERAAGPVRSFKYCLGAIEETAGAELTDAAAVGYLTRLEKGEG